jgi:hypothetical protein
MEAIVYPCAITWRSRGARQKRLAPQLYVERHFRWLVQHHRVKKNVTYNRNLSDKCHRVIEHIGHDGRATHGGYMDLEELVRGVPMLIMFVLVLLFLAALGPIGWVIGVVYAFAVLKR